MGPTRPGAFGRNLVPPRCRDCDLLPPKSSSRPCLHPPSLASLSLVAECVEALEWSAAVEVRGTVVCDGVAEGLVAPRRPLSLLRRTQRPGRRAGAVRHQWASTCSSPDRRSPGASLQGRGLDSLLPLVGAAAADVLESPRPLLEPPRV